MSSSSTLFSPRRPSPPLPPLLLSLPSLDPSLPLPTIAESARLFGIREDEPEPFRTVVSNQQAIQELVRPFPFFSFCPFLRPNADLDRRRIGGDESGVGPFRSRLRREEGPTVSSSRYGFEELDVRSCRPTCRLLQVPVPPPRLHLSERMRAFS